MMENSKKDYENSLCFSQSSLSENKDSASTSDNPILRKLLSTSGCKDTAEAGSDSFLHQPSGRESLRSLLGYRDSQGTEETETDTSVCQPLAFRSLEVELREMDDVRQSIEGNGPISQIEIKRNAGEVVFHLKPEYDLTFSEHRKRMRRHRSTSGVEED